MDTNNAPKTSKVSAIEQIQSRLPDKIFAAGFFQQDIPTSKVGTFFMAIGAVIGAVTTLGIASLIGAGTKNNMGLFWLAIGGVLGAVIAQGIYKFISVKINKQKDTLPKSIFLAIGADKVYVFEWQAGWSTLNIKEQVAVWTRKEIKVHKSTSTDPLLGVQPTVVIQVPNAKKPIIILQSTGNDEEQTVEMLTSEKE